MNANILATRSFSLHLKLFVAASACALALVLVPAPAHAAGLTQTQINAVLGLLSAFDVPQATIDNVRVILNGGATTPAQPAPTDDADVSDDEVDEVDESDEDESDDNGSLEDEDEDEDNEDSSGRDDDESSCSLTSTQVSQMQSWVNLHDRSEAAYNDLWKAIARAGHAPNNYISPNVSPTITQGPTIPDSLDGKTILRKDLYFAHDEAADARQACRNFSCSSYVLPSTHTAAQSALTKYQAAFEAMPKFAGPSGMMLSGSPQRRMGLPDYIKIKEQLASSQTCSANSGSSQTTTSPSVAPTAASSAKPSTAKFAAAAKTDVSTASSMLYGVIGSNIDMRDWATIMASPDPLATARALTSAMYNSGSKAYLAAGATRPQDRSATVWSYTAGNFTFYKELIPGVGDNYILALVDANGYQLTSAANPDVLAKLITNFGFNKSALASLQAQLTAAGINVQAITSWPKNFMSGVSVVPDVAGMMAAAAMVPLSTATDSLNMLADQVTEINYALAHVFSAYVALFSFDAPQAAAAATAPAAPSPVAGESLVATLAYLPESLHETMTGVTDMLAAVEMAPVYVITDALSEVLFQAGLY